MRKVFACTLVWLASAGCKGAGDASTGPSGSSASLPSLPPVEEQYAVEGEVVENSCGQDIIDDFRDLELKFDQVPTGLSVFLDPDIGWIPCEGSVEEFDCRWGNAPASTPGGTWNWALLGTSDGQTIEATLTLHVGCEDATGRCEECTIQAEVTGTID